MVAPGAAAAGRGPLRAAAAMALHLSLRMGGAWALQVDKPTAPVIDRASAAEAAVRQKCPTGRAWEREQIPPECAEALEEADVATVVQPTVRNVGRLPAQQTKVWIQGMKHTGSTLFLDLIRNGLRADWKESAFALFEPCHWGDSRAGEAPRPLHDRPGSEGDHSCQALLADVAGCDFDSINHLWGWNQWQPKGAYSSDAAHTDCTSSALEVFKTIHVHDLSADVLPIVQANPQLRVIHIVRDPRAVWWVNKKWYDPGYLCDTMLTNVGVTHPQILHVRFEDLILEPRRTIKEIAAFLNVPLDEKFFSASREWVKSRLKSKESDDCAELNNHGASSICKSNSTAQVYKWTQKRSLVLEAMQPHESCNRTIAARGYQTI